MSRTQRGSKTALYLCDELRINTALTRTSPVFRAPTRAEAPPSSSAVERPAVVLVLVQTLSGVIRVLDLFFLAVAALFFLAAWGLSGLLGRL